MRILVDGVPKEIGGIGTLIINIIQFNKKHGNHNKYVFEFILPQNSAYAKLLNDEGYVYYEVPRIISVHYRSVIKEIFKNKHYDYVWINNTSKVNIYLPHTAHKFGVKVVMHSHGISDEEYGIKKIIFHFIEKLHGKHFCELIDVALSCSTDSAEYFYPIDLRKNCKIVSNGIETSKYKFDINNRNIIRNDYSISENDILLGIVGRLSKVKNIVFALGLLHSLPDNIKLMVVGDGEDKDYICEKIKNDDLTDRVFLVGCKSDVGVYLSAMDVFLMPSLYEGMPFSLIEAQANGLKCIVSDSVTKDAKVNSRVEFYPLNNKDLWLKEINDCISITEDRFEAYKYIDSSVFNIEYSYNTFINAL